MCAGPDCADCAGCGSSRRPLTPLELIMSFLKPFSTLLVGIAIGTFVGPKILMKVRP